MPLTKYTPQHGGVVARPLQRITGLRKYSDVPLPGVLARPVPPALPGVLKQHGSHQWSVSHPQIDAHAVASEEKRVARQPPALDIPTGRPGLVSAAPGRPCASSSYFTQEATHFPSVDAAFEVLRGRLLLCVYVPWLTVVELLTGPGLDRGEREGSSRELTSSNRSSPTMPGPASRQ